MLVIRCLIHALLRFNLDFGADFLSFAINYTTVLKL